MGLGKVISNGIGRRLGNRQGGLVCGRGDMLRYVLMEGMKMSDA